jgi:hypothetical protein
MTTEAEYLKDIRHDIQLAIITLITIARQVRDGKTGELSKTDFEKTADLLKEMVTSAHLESVFRP